MTAKQTESQRRTASIFSVRRDDDGKSNPESTQRRWSFVWIAVGLALVAVLALLALITGVFSPVDNPGLLPDSS